MLVLLGFVLLNGCSNKIDIKDIEINKEISSEIDNLFEAKPNYAYTCNVTSGYKELKSNDPYSNLDPYSLKPYELTLFYDNNIVTRINIPEVQDVSELNNMDLSCYKFNNHVYIFINEVSGRLSLYLSNYSYITYSYDGGVTWSDLKSLTEITKTRFSIGNVSRFENKKILGGSENYSVSIHNLIDENDYLFDSQFRLLKKLTPSERKTYFLDESPVFFIHKGIIYVVKSESGKTLMQYSKDYGKTWSDRLMPYLKESYFLEIKGELYHFYTTPCTFDFWNGLRSFIPAWDKSNKCGELKVSRWVDGEWSEPIVLTKTAQALIGVYNKDKPLVLWEDLRFLKPRACGYIPLIGCVDSAPLGGPIVIYEGDFDWKKLKLDEQIISKDRDEFIKRL